MTPEEFAEQMRAIKLRHKDKAEASAMLHEAADVICDVLIEKGYGDGAEVFASMAK